MSMLKSPPMRRLIWFALAALLVVAALSFGLKAQNRARQATASKAGDSGFALYKKGDFKKAIPRLKEAVRLDPKNEAALRTLGQSYEAVGDLNKAASTYEAALAAKANQPEVLYNLAIIHKSQGKMDEAIEELEKAVSLNKRFVGARLVLAELFANSGNEAAAKEQYEAVLKLKPFGVDLKAVRRKLDAL